MVSEFDVSDKVVCIVGLGYVGFPLAVEFSKYFKVIGFDISEKKINHLSLNDAHIDFTTNPEKIRQGDLVVITVPTPLGKAKQPDLSFITSAARIVGRNLKKHAIVVLESTVYPGVTEEIMSPIIEKESGLELGKDFFIGYSPERVNPGDEEHTIDKITKIVAGMNKVTTENIAEFYRKITNVYLVKDIKTAEAAKIIENIQRDLNIALINEFALIFHRLGIDTKAVLDAAETKWNFIKFKPGLVGGHCIPVDPHYLVFKAQEIGYHPQVILAGRSVNDSMPKHVVNLTIKALNNIGKVIKNSKILIMGLTFKENVDDTRSSPSIDIINELKAFQCDIYGYDPLLSENEIADFGIKVMHNLGDITVDSVIITVAHDAFKLINLDKMKLMMNKPPILIDIRGIFKDVFLYDDFIYRSL